jgi:hypothetical protein
LEKIVHTVPGSNDSGFSWKSQLFPQTARLEEFGFKNQVSRSRDLVESAKMDVPEIHQNTLSYTKIDNKVNTSKNLFRCAHSPEAKNSGKMGTN